MTATVAALSSADPPARTIPDPIGFDRTSRSPGRAPALVHSRSGWAIPWTARPKMGSAERMVWPPATVPPASPTTLAAASKMAAMASGGKSSGKAAMLRASSTRPPMANTSLHALAAAMAPKSSGSSTRGGKKSVVDTRASSGPRR